MQQLYDLVKSIETLIGGTDADDSPVRILDAKSMATAFESEQIALGKGRMHLVTVELAVTSSTHVGSFYVKHGNVPANVANWDTVVLDTTPTVAAGAAYHFTLEFETGANYFVLGYLCTSGDGAATADAAIAVL